MSSQLLSKRVFSVKDWKKANRIERYYMYMMDPDRFALTDTEANHLNAIKRAFNLTHDKITRAEAITIIQDNIAFYEEWAKASKLFTDVQNLFGNLIKRNKEYQRTLLIEKLLKLADLAELEGNITEARRCLVAAGKFDHLDKPTEEAINPADYEIPEPLFTDDPKVLVVEDIDHEEIKEDPDA